MYSVSADSTYLVKISVAANSRPHELPEETANLDISQLLADGSALATESTARTAVWRVDLASLDPQPELVPKPSVVDYPGISPDGRHRIGIGLKSGISQIWLENVDGTKKGILVDSIPAFTDPDDFGVLTNLDCSPDGKWISFITLPSHGNADSRSRLYLVSTSGGPTRRLATKANSVE